MKEIFPKEILNNTVEAHHSKHHTKSKVIYGCILIAFIAALASLPFIKVDVYTSSRGIITPSSERVQLSLSQSGKIVQLTIRNNQTLLKGDTLLVIDDFAMVNDEQLATYQKKQNLAYLKDLDYLLNATEPNIALLQTAKYKKDVLQYKQQLAKLNTKLAQAKKDYKRNLGLYKKGIIAQVRFEEKKSAYDLALAARNQFQKQKLNAWQVEHIDFTNTLKKLTNQLEQIQRTKTLYVLKAPVTGTVFNLEGLREGTFLSAGQPIAEISPKTDLIAECFVSPADIGLLQGNEEVVFQIDAYNYNQWGLATGNIIEVSKDILMVNNAPMFKVKCTIDQGFLKLENGFKGTFKKGMTLNAQFILAERSLFDLLYDEVDNWLNPSKA